MDAAEAKSKISSSNPMKPHFFKPLLPGFLHGLLIPVAFFEDYLNHHGKSKNHDMAVLRTVLGEWKVKMKDRRLEEDGWRDFADHHSLRVGDMLVFRYEGELVFDVTVFDSTACERSYDHHHQPQVLEVKQESSLQKYTDSDDDDLQAPVVEQKTKVVNNNSAKASPKVATASSSSQAYPWFTSTLMPSNLKENRFFIPMGFSRSNGLCNRRCEMLILDDSERKSWQVKLSHKSGRVYIGGDGFRAVVAENGLRAGDDISFELISGGTNPVMVFHAPPRPSSHSSKRATATHPEAKKEAMKLPSHTPQCLKVKKELMKPWSSQYSNYFISTVTRASIVKSFLYIPRQFARWHGLNKCRNMTIEDPRERLWPVSLRYWTNRLRVTRGWKALALANELKDGQEIKLELVKEGKTLMMKFSFCGSEAVGIGLGKEEAVCSLSLRDGHRSETLAAVLFPVSEVAAAAHPVPPPLSNA